MLYIFFSILISTFLSFLIIKISNRFQIYDLPESRRLNKISTPRYGGLAISLNLFILSYLSGISIYPILISSIILISLVIFDDIFKLKNYLRLCCQIIAIVPSIISLYYSNSSQNIFFLFFMVLFMISFINLSNFFDGINTILITQFILIIIHNSYLINEEFLKFDAINLSLLSSSLVFLLFNFLNKLFMGDIGSYFIGFYSSYKLFEIGLTKGNQFFILSLFSMIPLLADTILTLLIRVKNKERFFSTPHKQHAYQLLVQLGFKHWQVSLIYSFKTILFCMISIVLLKLNFGFNIQFLILIFLGALNSLFILQVRRKAYLKGLI